MYITIRKKRSAATSVRLYIQYYENSKLVELLYYSANDMQEDSKSITVHKCVPRSEHSPAKACQKKYI